MENYGERQTDTKGGKTEDEGCFYAWQQIRTPWGKKDVHAVRAAALQKREEACTGASGVEEVCRDLEGKIHAGEKACTGASDVEVLTFT